MPGSKPTLIQKYLELGRLALPGLTSGGEIAVCTRCGNQVVFELKWITEGFAGYCAWHDEDLVESQIALHSFDGWKKIVRHFAPRLDYSLNFAILISRLKKG